MSLDFEKVKRVHEAASGNDKAEVSLLHNAVLDRMKAYQKHSTAANMKDWDAAKTALASLVEKLWPKYFPEEVVAIGPKSFDRQKDALEWLREKGYKRSAGQFSNDWNNGKVRVVNGAVSLADLVAYAANLDVDTKKIAGAEARAARKDELEIQILEEKVRRAELENRREDSRWVLKEDAEEHEAALIGLVQDGFRHQIYLEHQVLISACGGDDKRVSEFVTALQSFVDRVFNEVADGKQYEVEFSDEEEGA